MLNSLDVISGRQTFLDRARAGSGLVYLDPHGKAVKELLGLIPPERIDDVLYLDFTAKDRLFGWNMLAGVDDDTMAYHKTAGDFLKKLKRNKMSPPVESAIHYIVSAFIEANHTLMREEPDKLLTVADIGAFLTGGDMQALLLDRYIKDTLTRQWFSEFDELSNSQKAEIITSVRAVFQRMLAIDTVCYIVGQPRSTFRFDDIVKNKKIVLVNLDTDVITPLNTFWLSSMFLSYLFLAIRRNKPETNNMDLTIIMGEYYGKEYYTGLILDIEEGNPLSLEGSVIFGKSSDTGTGTVSSLLGGGGEAGIPKEIQTRMLFYTHAIGEIKASRKAQQNYWRERAKQYSG